jgi:hypothetical protein
MAWLCIAACTLTLGGTAVAGPAYQEADVSDAIESDTRAQVCDKEDDGFNAVVDYIRVDNTRSNVEDTNGAVSGCSNSAASLTKVKQHKTCERQVLRPDPCSAWAYE